MSASSLHPAFDPTAYAEDAPSDPYQEQVADLEYQIEQELASLRAIQAHSEQLARFVSVLQETRDEQRAMRQRFDQLLEILGAPVT